MYDDLEEEYAILGNFMFKYSEYLSYALGSKQANLVVDRLLIKHTDDLCKVKGEVYQAYIVMIKLHEGYSLIKEDADQDMINYIKKCCEIVQRTTDKFNGASQAKLDGDFTLVWRLQSDDFRSNFVAGNRNSAEAGAMCITCILKIIAKITILRRAYRIDEYINNLTSIQTGLPPASSDSI